MTIDSNTITPQYNALSGNELAQIIASAVYQKLSSDCNLNPGVTYKLFKLEFDFRLWWQNDLGELPQQLSIGKVRVEVEPNTAPDDVRRRYGLEVPK